MLIRKVTQSLLRGLIFNQKQYSTQDTYSCNYINTLHSTKAVLESTDLNDYKEHGSFFFDNAHTPDNKPTSDPAGLLEVFNTGYYIMQRWTIFPTNKMYIRWLIPYESNPWTDWVLINATSTDVDSNGITIVRTVDGTMYQYGIVSIDSMEGWSNVQKTIQLSWSFNTTQSLYRVITQKLEGGNNWADIETTVRSIKDNSFAISLYNNSQNTAYPLYITWFAIGRWR